MSLATGRKLHRYRWTSLPMPQDAIARVTALGARQGMPKTLTFADRFGLELPDADDAVDDDHDSDYGSDDASSSDDDSSFSGYTSDGSDASDSISSDDPDSDDSDSDDDDSAPGDRPPSTRGSGGAAPRPPAGITGVRDPRVEQTKAKNIDIKIEPDADAIAIAEDDDLMHAPDDESETDESEDEHLDDQINSDRESVIADDHSVGGSTREADAAELNVNGDEDGGSDDDGSVSVALTGVGNDASNAAKEMDARYGPRNNRYDLRERRPRSYSHRYDFQYMCDEFLFLTEQMSLRRGLKQFGKKGADAVVAELQQIDYRRCIKPVFGHDLSREDKHWCLRYLMYLKEKRCGRIKARGCADGRKQRLYKSKEETSSPTVLTESVFLTSVIDAMEKRYVVTLDVPGAFMQSDIDEVIHVKFEGEMAELLTRVNPTKYQKYMMKEKGKSVIYVQLEKALYGTLQAALLFWRNLSGFLVNELGFVINKYDKCVANKTINGKQCTIIWHVDDLKISHVDSTVVEEIVQQIDARYGKEAPVTVTRGKKHDYLGMTIDYTAPGKVTFSMNDYVENLLEECPDDMLGTAATPAAKTLFEINDAAPKLEPERAEQFHHLTAKTLYLCKRVRPDLQTAVAFLCTRVKQPDLDDWKKLGRCMRYLRGTKTLPLTLEASPDGMVQWFVDASFAVHKDKRSHTGIAMTLGKGCPISGSIRQKLNTRSSTEAELVGVDDGMPLVLWTRNFLYDQGFNVTDNIVYQDNQSAILLERNGKASSGRRTRHIDIRYFFVTDRINKGELRVEYCPTTDMLADFFTKPLQGSVFRKLRARILNLPIADLSLPVTTAGPQECVESGSKTWADVVRRSGELVQPSPANDKIGNANDMDDKMAGVSTSTPPSYEQQ
jgi:hypothetical protein